MFHMIPSSHASGPLDELGEVCAVPHSSNTPKHTEKSEVFDTIHTACTLVEWGTNNKDESPF